MLGRKAPTIRAEHLSSHDLLVEECLPFLNVGRKALGLGLVNLGLDFVPLPLRRCLGLFLFGSNLSTLVPPEVAAEFGLAAALIVKVESISYGNRACKL